MPTYEYACKKCGHTFEKFQSMRDEPLKKCPKCHRAALKRLVGGGAGLIFKGSGFYITDYAKKGPRPAEGGEAKPSGDSKGPAESKPSGASKPADSGSKPADGGSKPAAASADSSK